MITFINNKQCLSSICMYFQILVKKFSLFQINSSYSWSILLIMLFYNYPIISLYQTKIYTGQINIYLHQFGKLWHHQFLVHSIKIERQKYIFLQSGMCVSWRLNKHPPEWWYHMNRHQCTTINNIPILYLLGMYIILGW